MGKIVIIKKKAAPPPPPPPISEDLAFLAAKYGSKDVAKIAGVSIKTFRVHLKNGFIRYHSTGNPGAKRKTYRFSESNVHTYLKNLKHKDTPACPSTSSQQVLSTFTTSKLGATDIMAVPKPQTKKKLKQ